MQNQVRTTDKWIFVGLFAALFAVQFYMQAWHNKVFNHQALQWDYSLYYVYLPATFIYNDVALEKQWPVDLSKHQVSLGSRHPETGRFIYKMSSGMAWIYFPAFVVGHAVASFLPSYQATGFSMPYQVAITIWLLVLTVLGSWALYRLLLRFVDRLPALLTSLILVLGTNVFYYAVWEAASAHLAGFALLAICIEGAYRLASRPKWWGFLLWGFALGLVVLIRPINAILAAAAGLAFLLQTFKKGSFSMLLLMLAVAASCIPWLGQMAVWKYSTGNFIYYSYREEGFFWFDPQFVNGLFSWRKGWLIYTPIMVFSLVGFIPLFKQNKMWFWVVLSVFLLYTYVVFSWWCWWYGGSYSQRSLIDVYPFLAIPLAFFVHWVWQSKIARKAVFSTAMVVLLMYNLFTSFQYIHGLIHHDSMSKNTYKAIFMSLKWPKNYSELLNPPNYEAALKGDRDQ